MRLCFPEALELKYNAHVSKPSSPILCVSATAGVSNPASERKYLKARWIIFNQKFYVTSISHSILIIFMNSQCFSIKSSTWQMIHNHMSFMLYIIGIKSSTWQMIHNYMSFMLYTIAYKQALVPFRVTLTWSSSIISCLEHTVMIYFGNWKNWILAANWNVWVRTNSSSCARSWSSH